MNPSGRFPQEIALPAAANANNFYKCAKVQNAKNIYARQQYTRRMVYKQYLHAGICYIDHNFRRLSEKLTFFACIKQ
jgi:hypothetical protein